MTHALQYSLEQKHAPRRTALTLLTINQANGIDCPGCAWPEPEPGKRHINEYCENGAKHINDEATTRRITREFFQQHPISELANKSDMWLNQQGRLTEPMCQATRLGPLRTHRAGTARFDLLAAQLRGGLTRPTRRSSTPRGGSATRRRFCWQLFARAFWVPTIFPTAATCATSPVAPRCSETLRGRQGHREASTT